VKRRVVITGIGVVSPLGNTTEELWAGLVAGRSGIGPITRFDAAELPCRIAGEVRDFEPLDWMDRRDIKKTDAFIQYALAASRMAVGDAGLEIGPDAERIGVAIGSGIGGIGSFERQHQNFLKHGVRRISPFFIPAMIVNLASGQVSIALGAKGPNTAVATACATGTHAIGDSLRLVQRGEADAMLAGGTEATITPMGVGGFCAMKALSTRNGDPTRASRPFDLERDGFVMGEGAGVLVLEERERALARGAQVYAEVVGYGMSGDAHHVSAPTPDGEGAIRAMTAALADADVRPEDVGYVNTHGTSTPAGDRIEVQAIKVLFGEHAPGVAASSTKSMTGHLLGAAGGVETAITALALRHGMLPPTINLENPDPECDLDFVPGEARPERDPPPAPDLAWTVHPPRTPPAPQRAGAAFRPPPLPTPAAGAR
jgi:3-oxoacyl-[acyl-carrier-protein] synthase II